MIIQSDYLTEGLFGQLFAWMLQILPYVDSHNWRPDWRILSKNYGRPPDFNIFPEIIKARYAPDESDEIVSFEELKWNKGFHFKDDFRAASERWNSHFEFPEDIQERLEQFWRSHFDGATVLGVHYRGTDKNADPWQTNPVSRFQFLCIVEDFLKTHPDVSAIFIASDDARFIEMMRDFPRAHSNEQRRSENDQPVWKNHDVSANIAHAKDAILDSLSLSRCRYVLKCMSALSGFAKVFNPDVDVYRVAAMKQDWFPDSYIEPYRSKDRAIRALVHGLRRDDCQARFSEKTAWRTEKLVQRATRKIKKLRHRLTGGTATQRPGNP